MKKIMLSIAGTMVICLCMALVFYQFSQESGPLTLAKPKMVPKVDQSKQNVQVQQTGSTIDYSLTTGELQITFDKGKSWTTVPIETDKLFAGEYNGNKQELIENSYLLTENRAAFLYADGPDQFDKNIVVTYSLDHGKHWQDSIVTKHYPALRFRKVDFLNQNFGYVILSGDRTVSQEMSNVYLTHDGGGRFH